jgi:hypothetical protein
MSDSSGDDNFDLDFDHLTYERRNPFARVAQAFNQIGNMRALQA